jgi:hypothetical protein
MQSVQLPPINIPGVVSNSLLINCINNNGSYAVNDHQIEPSTEFVQIIAFQIVQHEMSFIRDRIDLTRVQQMIDGSEGEMFDLAMNILEGHGCKYSPRILRSMKFNEYYRSGLESIVYEFIQRNKLNITNNFK